MRRAALPLIAFLAVFAGAAPIRAQDGAAPAAPVIRDVTGEGMTPAPQGEGPLVREPTPPAPAPEPRWRRFFLPVTTDAATFLLDKITLRISGVTPPPYDETCRPAAGEPWPCGRTALYAFRSFLRGRAVECYFPRPDSVELVIAPCRVGTTDLGAWLLAQGWAKPDERATDAYRSAAQAAACAGLGLWRGEPQPASGCD